MNRRGFFACLLAPLIARCAPPRLSAAKTGLSAFPSEPALPIGIYGRRCYSFTVPAETWEALFPGWTHRPPLRLWFSLGDGEQHLCSVGPVTLERGAATVSLTEMPTIAQAFDSPEYPGDLWSDPKAARQRQIEEALQNHYYCSPFEV